MTPFKKPRPIGSVVPCAGCPLPAHPKKDTNHEAPYPPHRILTTLAAGLVTMTMAAPVAAQMSEPTCLPGYTATQVPLPGAPSWMRAMTWRCMADGTGSAPNIESADPTRRSTLILSLAGSGRVHGCGPGHETQINIRATGGFFAAGQSATADVRLRSGLADNELNFERTDAGVIAIFKTIAVNVTEGDNVVPIRYQAAPLNSGQVNPGGKHVIRLELVDDTFNTENTWQEHGRNYTQKYRIAPTGAIQIVFDLDGPGCA